MSRRGLFYVVLALNCSWAPGANGFRTCDQENSEAFSASTQYVVGEISFNRDTGIASGTETTYNYANRAFEGFSQCHVTYELSGSYESSTETFILDARRTAHSSTCPDFLIDLEYPSDQTYALQMTFDSGGASAVHRADSGEFLAYGSWEGGRTNYKTDEKCTIF